MPLRLWVTLTFMLLSVPVTSQEIDVYDASTISTELKRNSNAVIRWNEKHVHLESFKKMRIKVKRIVTVLNKQGDKDIDAFVYYDDGININKLQVLIYDTFGKEIKKIKKKDFKDVSAVDGGTLYSRSRVKYLDHTAISYPYTVELTYETETENTAFIPSFYPLDTYFVSVEHSTYVLKNPSELDIRLKEINCDGFNIVKDINAFEYRFEASNINAIKPEDYGPSLSDLVPRVMFASNKFMLEGVEGNVENWDDFGKWMYQDLLDGNQTLPEETIAQVRALVKNETSDIDKAKKIYEYVQNKTRYISVQVGIGGWKPFDATEVDKLSYGDCKGLTNYTMSLLDAVGVDSNYTVVFSGNSKKDIDKDFASIQGNHVILSIPNQKDTVWLECTSQKLPFGFIGDFTDDRDVLVITPEGGKIQHTKKYTTNENIQKTSSKVKVLEDGSIEVTLKVVSEGIQYDNKYWLETENQRNLDRHYKNRWDYINNMTIDDLKIVNNKDDVFFEENLSYKATNYGNLVGDRMLLVVNAINRNTFIPDRYRDRKLPLKLNRGFKDIDEMELQLPQGYIIEALPKNEVLESQFGSYKFEIEKLDDNTLRYTREFIVNEGEYPKEDYKAFRDFHKKVNKLDNSKIALIKNN